MKYLTLPKDPRFTAEDREELTNVVKEIINNYELIRQTGDVFLYEGEQGAVEVQFSSGVTNVYLCDKECEFIIFFLGKNQTVATDYHKMFAALNDWYIDFKNSQT